MSASTRADPTVYGPTHIGNFRSFLFADLLVRHLRHRGLRVTWVMNITDIDDKIIRGAAAEGVSTAELAERWTARFLADADALGMTRPDVVPQATGHIPQITAMVQTLLDKGHAYRTDDGSIFFRIASWPGTGCSRSWTRRRCASGSASRRTSTPRRRSATSPCGRVPRRASRRGRPPSARAARAGTSSAPRCAIAHLGESFDVHTGGVDLVFPHHEDEIAQSEAATGKPFVQTWLHCAHLRMGGEKMAKSTGNIARVADLLAAGVSPRALRYALIAVHYRAALNYGDDTLAAATAAVERIDAAARGARRLPRGPAG